MCREKFIRSRLEALEKQRRSLTTAAAAADNYGEAAEGGDGADAGDEDEVERDMWTLLVDQAALQVQCG